MPTQPHKRWIRIAVMAAGFLLLLVLTAWRGGSVESKALPALGLWLVMVGLAARVRVPLLGGRRGRSLEAPLDLAALLALGVVPACWLVVAARFLAACCRRRVGLSHLGYGLFAAGEAGLGLGIAGVVLTRLAGTAADFATGDGSMLALPPPGWLAAAAVFFCTRAVGSVITAGRRGRAKLAEVRGVLVWEAVLLGFGLSLALVQTRLGTPASALFLIPLAVAGIAGAALARAQRGHVEAVRSLMTAVDAADPVTRGHAERIAKMSVAVARRLGLDSEAVQELEYAAFLHDVGRTAIQRDVLLKPGALSTQERSVLRTHPRVGSALVQRFGFFPGAAPIILAHHEQPDGQGYPQGTVADEIPMGSRILMAVAAFDAMTSERPYRRGLSPEAAFEELLAKAGQQFFPDVVEVIIELYSSGELFAGFDAEVLERHARGEGNSRALEAYLARTARPAAAAQAKETAAESLAPEVVPMLDMPPQPRGDVKRAEFELGPGLRLRVAALTDVGCKREQNEDAFGLFRNELGKQASHPARGCLLVVADGMGGAAAGEVASTLAVDMLRESYFGNGEPVACGEALQESMRLTNELIHWRATADAGLAGMGTTCTAAAIAGSELHVSHVGDSRAHLFRGDTVQTLTQDHTVAAQLQMAGAPASPRTQSMLTRCLGAQTAVDVDLARPVRLEPGDVLLLCSDGLWGQVELHEMRDVVRDETPELACTALVERARERGGPDNITVVVARVQAT